MTSLVLRSTICLPGRAGGPRLSCPFSLLALSLCPSSVLTHPPACVTLSRMPIAAAPTSAPPATTTMSTRISLKALARLDAARELLGAKQPSRGAPTRTEVVLTALDAYYEKIRLGATGLPLPAAHVDAGPSIPRFDATLCQDPKAPIGIGDVAAVSDVSPTFQGRLYRITRIEPRVPNPDHSVPVPKLVAHLPLAYFGRKLDRSTGKPADREWPINYPLVRMVAK